MHYHPLCLKQLTQVCYSFNFQPELSRQIEFPQIIQAATNAFPGDFSYVVKGLQIRYSISYL